MSTLADRVGGKDRVIGGPFGSNLTQRDYVSNGVPVIRGANMEHHGRWIGGDFVFVSTQKAGRSLSSNVALPGDIVVTQRGTLGQVSIVPSSLNHTKYIVSQSQMAISVDEREADPHFVYYYLRSPEFNDYVANTTIQAGVPHINLGILRNAPVDWPDRATQAQIARTLGCLDDKIELNRRMNETLEAMAQAIFRDWFVDFGPARRKIEGASNPVEIMGGLINGAEPAQQLADLFPSRLGDNGLPEGWEERAIGDLADIAGGSTPSTNEPSYWENGAHAWATPRDLSKLDGLLLFETERKITDAGLKKITSGLSPVGTVLLSSRAPIGYLAIAATKVAVNQGFIAIRPTKSLPTEYALFWCKENMDLIKANANGSTFQEINKRSFRPLKAVMPGHTILGFFTDIVQPLVARIELNLRNSIALAEARDFLLPKLMSGEVRIKDADAAVMGGGN